MRTGLSLYILFSIVLIGCRESGNVSFTISSPTADAESVYLTRDHNNAPVVAWTERREKELEFYFAIGNDKEFGKPIRINTPDEIATHAEGMPKVAFKSDGTVVAAFETKAPTAQNKYAGAVYFVQSSDNGKSWSAPSFVHSDTVGGKSRSFFDIERLPDGEIGAAWLDIKLNNQIGGRSVRFARTTHEGGFTNEVLIDSSACECCRIDVFADRKNVLHIAYRGSAPGSMGQTIRDIMISSSTDGSNFTSPVRISADNWKIEGCPHTGPALANDGKSLHAIWYTEGGSTGVFHSVSQEEGTFSKRQAIALKGRHPQLAAAGDRIALVWEERAEDGAASVNTIHYELRDAKQLQQFTLENGKQDAYYPVILGLSHYFVLAWLEKRNGGTTVNIRWIK